MDSTGNIHTALVMSKTKVSPLKYLSIPRLELCGAHILTKLLGRIKIVFSNRTTYSTDWWESIFCGNLLVFP